MSTKITILLFVIALASAIVFANSLSNGDFELGRVAATWNDAPDVSSWVQTGGTAVDNKVHLSDGSWVGASNSQFDESAVSSDVTAADRAVKWRWGNKGIYQEFSAVAGIEYYFSVEVLNDPGFAVSGRNLQIRVSWYNGSGGGISTNAVVAEFDPEIQTDVGVWHFVAGSMSAPTGAAEGRMELWSQKKASNTGVFFADNAYASDEPIAIDTTPPAPDLMTFEIAPFAMGASAVSMIAAVASDESDVQYYFSCTLGGGNDSGWQSGRIYTDIGLTAETTYAYTVKARDLSSNHNETAACDSVSVTTEAESVNTTLVNGDFEVGETGQFNSVIIPGWIAWGDGGWHHSDAGQTVGANAIKVSATGSGVYQDISAIGGYQYFVVASMASFSGTALIDRDGVLKLEWFDGSTLIKREVAGYFVGGLYGDDEWRTVSAAVSSPVNATKLRVVLHIADFPEGRYTPAGTCYFDDVVVTPIGATLCGDGDLNEDCQVDMGDIVELSLGWNDDFGVFELAELASFWLECTMHDQGLCFQ